MVKAIQIPFYNKFQAAKPALNPYATIKHQPPRHSELVSESNPLHPQQSNLALIKGLIALNQITPVSFKGIEEEHETKIAQAFIYSKDVGYDEPPKTVKADVTRSKGEMLGEITFYKVKLSNQSKELGHIITIPDSRTAPNLGKELEDYRNSSIFIEELEARGNDNYKGIGTALIEQALKESFRQGKQGRITVNAQRLHKDDTPPTPFYYKMGFRFPEDYQNEAMEIYLHHTPRGTNYKMPTIISQSAMYLPEKNIPILLKQAQKVHQARNNPADNAQKHTTIYKQTLRDKREHREPRELPVILKIKKDGTMASYKMYAPEYNDKIANMKTGECTLPCEFPISKKHKKYYADSRVVIWLENEIGINKNYKGIGTALMKQAVLDSIENGHGGKIFLFASPLGEGRKSPVEFYYKMGLEFCEKDKHEAMEEYLKKKAMAEEKVDRMRVPDKIRKGYMYLPEENIDQLLNKKIQK